MQSCFDIVSIRVLVYKLECRGDTVESIILWIEETEKKQDYEFSGLGNCILILLEGNVWFEMRKSFLKYPHCASLPYTLLESERESARRTRECYDVHRKMWACRLNSVMNRTQ